MGIFGDIAGEIGAALPGLAVELGRGLIRREFAPEQPRPIIIGGGPPSMPGGGGFVSTQPFPVSFQQPPLMTTPALEVPESIPFFPDPGVGQSDLFKPVRAGQRAVPWITAKNPATGAVTFWEHAGRPILFTRDLRTCKRVARIASRAARSRPRRRTTRKR